MRHLPPELMWGGGSLKDEFTGPKTLKSMERFMISETLRRHKGNRKLAAKDLGIDYSTLYRKIRDLEIETPSTDGRSRKK
jgi:transcriptional regulator with PAS, ATPase and Fis domain